MRPPAYCRRDQDFELAVAVASGVFGFHSGQALAGGVGPLMKVPALIALVHVAFWFRRRWHGVPSA